MKRWIVPLAVAVLSAGVGSAQGDGSPVTVDSIATFITHDATVDLGGGKSLIGGQVISHREICQMDRLVKLTAHYPNGTTQLLDLDITSDGGAWSVKADIGGADRLKAKVTRQARRRPNNIAVSGGRPRPRHHPPHRKGHHPRLPCAADSIVWGPD